MSDSSDRNILCSFLIPSRGRARQLTESVASIFRTAENPDSAQVILKVDHDDRETVSILPNLVGRRVITIISDRRNGWGSAPEYHKEMMPFTNGRWICFWNDDATMVHTDKAFPPWDAQLAKLSSQSIVYQEWHRLNKSGYRLDDGGPFPFIPFWAVKDAAGLSPSGLLPHPVDTQMRDYFRNRGAKPIFLQGIAVQHDREESK